MALGPVELLVIKFPGNQFRGEIVPALTELIEQGTIRVIDILFAIKDGDGEVAMVEINDLDDDDFARFDPVVEDITGLLTREDIEQISAALEPNSSAAMMLFENTWATRLRDAVVAANCEVVVSERIPRAVIDELMTVAATAEA